MTSTPLTTHFTLEEFTRSARAEELHIDNSITDSQLIEAALRTCTMQEKIRLFLTVSRGRDVQIDCESGYRCQALNRATPGAPWNSDHIRGAAMDWRAAQFGDTFTIASLLASRVDELGIGQLILEFPGTPDSWIHTGTIRPMSPTNRILTHTAAGYRPGIWGA